MSQKTTYTCDRCGHTHETTDKIYTVVLFVKEGPGAYLSNYDFPSRRRDWCLDCVSAFQLLPPKWNAPKVPDAPSPPTIEDIIREIVRDEVSNQ